jgi:hypothetical protein
MDAVVLPENSISLGNFAENLFDPTPTDSRFQFTSFTKHFPTNSLAANASQIVFDLPDLTANSMYMFHNTLLYVEVKITKPDGTYPDKGVFVAPANNVRVDY